MGYYSGMRLDTTARVGAAVFAIPRNEWRGLAKKAGVPWSTLVKIAYGYTSRSNYDNTLKLADALRRRAGL